MNRRNSSTRSVSTSNPTPSQLTSRYISKILGPDRGDHTEPTSADAFGWVMIDGYLIRKFQAYCDERGWSFLSMTADAFERYLDHIERRDDRGTKTVSRASKHRGSRSEVRKPQVTDEDLLRSMGIAGCLEIESDQPGDEGESTD